MFEKLFKKKGPRDGDSYGVLTGDYCGELLIFVEKDGDRYGFLSSPNMTNRYVPIDKFDFALKESIIEYIERVPKFVQRTSQRKFRENKPSKL